MQFGDLSIFNGLAYKRQSQDIDLFSRGDYSPLARYLRESYPNTDLPIRAIPFVQRYVDELTGLYSHAPLRRFSPYPMAPAVFAKLLQVYRDSQIDRAGEESERYLWTQNTYLAILMPDGVGKVREQPILPHQIDIIEIDDAMRADDPSSWSRVLCRVPMSNVSGNVVYGQMELTREKATRQLGGKSVGIYQPDGMHPFGIVPLIVVHRTTPDPGRALPPINEAVLNCQVALATQAADNELIIRHCAWPQKVVTNGTIGMQAETLDGLGPDSIYMLPNNDSAGAGPDMKVVQGQVPVTELVAHTEHQIRVFTSLLGLDPSAFLRQGGVAVTAEARLFTAQDRKAIRDRIIPVLQRLESSRLKLLVQILALREPMPMPADLSVDVAFYEDVLSAGRQSDAQALAIEVPLGVNSPVDVVMARDGVNRTTAMATVKNTLDELRALGLIPDPAALADGPQEAQAEGEPAGVPEPDTADGGPAQ